MVICKFFLQGNCRYNDRCWNEHPSGGNQGYSVSAQRQLFGGGGGGRPQQSSSKVSFGPNQNPYKWVSSDVKQQPGQTNTQQQVSATDIVKGLSTEMKTWESSNMWPFSVLGFEKDSPCIPGFDDVSPEELRLEAYEAEKAGTIQPYIQKVESLVNDLNNKRNEMKNPNMTLKQKLISFVDDSRRQKPGSSSSHVSLFSGSSGGFGQVTTGSQSGAGAFGSQSSGFGASGSQSLFGQPQPATQGAVGQSSLFGKPQSDQTTGQSQNSFGQSSFGQASAFGQQTGTQPGLFGQQTGTQPGLFGQQTGSQPGLFGQQTGSQPGLFGQQTGTQPGLFGQQTATPSGLFGQQTGTQSSVFGQTSGSQPAGLFGKTDNANTSANPQVSSATPQSLFGASGPTVVPNTPAQTGSGLFGGSTNSQTGSAFGGSSAFGSSTAAVVPSGSTFGHSAAGHQPAQTGSLYTPLDKLTAEELEQFQAATFTLGKIPTKPPPRELCF